jgi:dipeptidyl aminopeptidase/acylaminoacyl peptidase
MTQVALKGPREYAFEQFFAVRRHFNYVFSPDGKEIAFITDITGQFNVWRIPSTGGFPRQVTDFTDKTVRTLAWSDRLSSIIFTADTKGDENYQIYMLPHLGGIPERITSQEGVQYNFVGPESLAPDGQTIAYSCNEQDPSTMDVFVKELSTGQARLLLGGRLYYPAGFSRDLRYLLIIEPVRVNQYNTLLYDLKSGRSRVLLQQEGTRYHICCWAPDSKGFYVITDQDRDFSALAFYNLDTGRLEPVEAPEAEVIDATLSSDGRYLAWVVNKDTKFLLFLKDLVRKVQIEVPIGKAGDVEGIRFAPDSRFLAFYMTGPTRPRDLFIFDIPGGVVKQLTFSMFGGIDEADLVEPEIVRYKSFDERYIQALLYRPKRGGDRVPVVVALHGGPEWQERPLYSGLYQYLLNRGIGLFAPNFRGSSGYGKGFRNLINRDWGGGELKDVEYGVRFLETVPWVDMARLGLFGGSFGGFLTLSCATRLPGYWRCAVDICGPSNLVTFLKNCPPWWRGLTGNYVGDPEEDRDFLLSRSPVSYLDDLCCPLLVVQGVNDPRVPKTESDQIVGRLRSKGIPVEYVLFEDEGHGFTKRANQLKAWRLSAEFLQRHLYGKR